MAISPDLTYFNKIWFDIFLYFINRPTASEYNPIPLYIHLFFKFEVLSCYLTMLEWLPCPFLSCLNIPYPLNTITFTCQIIKVSPPGGLVASCHSVVIIKWIHIQVNTKFACSILEVYFHPSFNTIKVFHNHNIVFQNFIC